MGSWHLVGTAHHEAELVTIWRHPTGASHLHRHEAAHSCAFGMTFRTPATDDTGAAHVLEHWVGAGSAAYPMSSALLTASQRSLSAFLNGFTETGRTSYTFTTSDATDLLDLLAVVLDAVYRPLLREREFLREGCRGVVDEGRPDAAPSWTGVVYNEMLLKPESSGQWFARLAARHVRPFGFDQHRHEGIPAALAQLDVQSCRHFHTRHYRPSNAHSFAMAPGHVEILDTLAAAHERRQAELTGQRPPRARAAGAPLYPPPGMAGATWQAARVRFDNGGRDALCTAFRIHRLLREDWADLGASRVLTRPELRDGVVELLAGIPLSSAGASSERGMHADRAEAAAVLREELVRATRYAASEPAGEPVSSLVEPYRALPQQVGFGLALAPACLSDVNPTATTSILEASSVSRPRETLWPEVSTFTVDATGHLAVAGRTAFDERVRRAAVVWCSKPASQDASCLPLRRLADRRLPRLPRLEQLAPALERLDVGSPGVLAHVLLPVVPDTAHLIGPLTRLLGRLLYVDARDEPAALLTQRIRVRHDDHQPVVDLFVQGWSPVGWSDLLKRLVERIAEPEGVAELTACIWACLRDRSRRLLVAPHELAENAALAWVSRSGAGQDAVDGLPAMLRWRELVASGGESPGLAGACQAAAGRLGRSRCRFLVLASDIPADIRAQAAELSSRNSADDQPSIEPIDPIAVHVRADGGRDSHAGAWPISPDQSPATFAVLAADVRRRLAHRLLREEDGAYGAHAGFDRLRAGFSLWTHADPISASRTEQLARLVETHYAPPGDDDLETARLMAANEIARHDRDLATTLQAVLPSGKHHPPALEEILPVTAEDLEGAAGLLLAEKAHVATVGYASATLDP